MWWREHVKEIQQKAETGEYVVRGFGTSRKLPHFDDLVILPAQVSRPPIDKYREPCNTKTVLGDRFAEKPLKLDTPILVGAMSFGALSKEAKIAVAKGTAMVGTATNTGEGGMLPEEREEAKWLIAQYASGRFGVSAEYLNAADAIEIKIGQGAKPGMGGHLMGEKVTKEIAEIRGIPEGSDALSPSRHMDIVGPEDLKMKIEQLREITDWKVPIIVKYSPGRVKEDVKIAAKAGADIIAIDGMQGGTGASPEIATENAGIPTIAALVQAVEALNEIGMREEVDIIISGGIRDGADVAKALALGADAVYVCTGVLIAMGCTACMQCHAGVCPVGICTQDPELRKKLDVDEAARRVANYLKVMTEECKMLAQLAGKTDVHNLEKEDLRALSLDVAAITGVKMVGSDLEVTGDEGPA